MSEARKGAPKIALNMSMVKTIMWDKGPDYTFERGEGRRTFLL